MKNIFEKLKNSTEIIFFFLISFIFTYYCAFKPYGMRLFDIAYIIEPVFRIYKNQIPYRDFFCPITPGTFYIQSLIWKIFDPSFFVMKLYMGFVNAIFICILYLFLRKLRLNKVEIFFLLMLALSWSPFIMVTVPWFSSDASLVAFFCFLTLYLFLKTDNKLWIVSSGILSGLCFIFKQNDGFGCILGSLSFYLLATSKRGRLKNILIFLIATFSVFVLFLLYYYLKGSLDQTLEWVFLRAGSGKVGQSLLFFLLGPFLSLFGHIHNFLKLLFLLYIFTWSTLIYKYFQCKNFQNNKVIVDWILLLLFSSIYLYLGLISQAGNNFALYQIFIWVPFLICFINIQQKYIRLAIFFICAVFIFQSYRISILRHIYLTNSSMRTPEIDYDFKFSTLHGMKYYNSAGEPIDYLTSFLANNIKPDENLFVFPEPIMLYYALGKLSPNKVLSFVGGNVSLLKSDQKEVLNSMKGKNVRWAIFQIPTEHEYSDHLKYPEIIDYIASSYEIKEMFFPYIVLYRENDDYQSSLLSKQRFYKLYKTSLESIPDYLNYQ